jgi:glycosyltransferase involved in cell wall biosynthesis
MPSASCPTKPRTATISSPPRTPDRPPLRILFLAPQPFFEVRGTPLAVLAMARALAGLGHRVDLLTYPQGEEVNVPGLIHRRSLRLPVGRVKAGPSLAKLLLDVPFMAEAAWRMATGAYDVVHAVEEAAHLAAPFTRLFRLPLVADVDSSIPDQLAHSPLARGWILPRLARVLEGHALRHAVAAITVCRSLTDGVRNQAPGTPVFQVEDPPLVDPSAPPDPRDVARLRETLGLGGGPVVLYSGNFEPYQGVDLLLEAAGRVKSSQFVFMGGEQREIAAMRARSVWAGASERCFFAGKRSPAELPAFLALADVVVSPRRQGENTPFKVYTYMASGRPLVATRIPTHTQLLDDSLAFLVEPSPEGLAGGIEAALADRAGAGRRADCARALVEREYSPDRYLAKVRGAYEGVFCAIHKR